MYMNTKMFTAVKKTKYSTGKIILRASIYSKSRGANLVICSVMFLDPGTCKYNFTDWSSLSQFFQWGALHQST